MGVFERDNSPFYNSGTGRSEYKQEGAPPLAVTDRVQANKMLGG